MALEVLGDSLGVGTDALDTQRQCLETLQQIPGGLGAEGRPHVAQWHDPGAGDKGRVADVSGIADAVIGGVGLVEQRKAFGMAGPGEATGIDDHATHGGAVATDILGRGVHHDIGAVFDRSPQEGRGHGVVDDQRDTVVVGHLGECGDVHHTARRVADTFAEHRLGTLIDAIGDAGEVVLVGEADLDALARQGVGKEVVGTAVEFADRDDIVAAFGKRLDGIGNGGHAGGHRQAGDTTFQGGHTIFQHRAGGVHDARIDVALDLEIEQVGGMLGIIEGKRCGLVDRDRDRVLVVRGVAVVQGEGFAFHGSSFDGGSWSARGAPDGVLRSGLSA